MKKLVVMALTLFSIINLFIPSVFAEASGDISAYDNQVSDEKINIKAANDSNAEILEAGRSRALKARSQSIPYSTPWGKMYRDPEESNNYGRAWYNTISYRGCPSIYFESYYNYGVNASVIYTYVKNGKKKVVKTNDSGACTACVDYTREKKYGESYSIRYYGSGYKFTVDKTLKA